MRWYCDHRSRRSRWLAPSLKSLWQLPGPKRWRGHAQILAIRGPGKLFAQIGVRLLRREAVGTLAATAPEGDREVGVIWHTQGSGKSQSTSDEHRTRSGALPARPASAGFCQYVVKTRTGLASIWRTSAYRPAILLDPLVGEPADRVALQG